MSEAPVRSAASTPEALHAIIVDAFNRGGVGAFLAAHDEGASVVIPGLAMSSRLVARPNRRSCLRDRENRTTT
jgi:hypothetical protein